MEQQILSKLAQNNLLSSRKYKTPYGSVNAELVPFAG